MKYTYLLILALFACKHPVADLPQERTAAQVIPEAVTIVSRTPDLAPVKYQIAYEGYPFGVISQPPQLKNSFTINGELGNWISFLCPIENIGVTSGNSYSPLVLTGTDYSGADFIWQGSIPNFLYVAVFQNGLPVSVHYKDTWRGGDGDHIYNYKPELDTRQFIRYYGGDTGWLHPMFADIYTAYGKLNATPSGKFAMVITYNQEDILTRQRRFVENDYENNTTSVGFNVAGTSIEWDESSLADNTPRSVTGLTGLVNWKGQQKTVTLTWVCPYHQVADVYHEFRIKKDGIVIADNWRGDNEVFTDIVKPPFKSATYSVEIKIDGLGISLPTEINVTK